MEISHRVFSCRGAFEARKPKARLAVITEIKGVATINDTKKKREIIVTDPRLANPRLTSIPYGSRIKIMDGQVEAGDELTEGSVNPHDILSELAVLVQFRLHDS